MEISGSTANATLSTPQLASHSHPKGPGNPDGGRTEAYSNPSSYRKGAAQPSNTGNTGSGNGHAHNMSANFTGDATSVLQPYLTIMYIIKT